MTPVILTRTRVIRDRERATVAAGRYVWRGPASDPVFLFQDCRDALIEHVDVVCETQCRAMFRCERTKTGAGVIPNTNHLWRNVRMYGNQLAYRGVEIGGIDENGEHMHFDHVSVYGCTDAAFTFAGDQSKEHLLTHCRIESCDVGIDAWTSFQWIGGTCAVARLGVHLMHCGDPITIQGVGFEACGRLLVTDGPATDAQSVTLTSVRYAADQLHPDGAMIVLRHAGPLLIMGGAFGDGDQRPPHIRCEGIGEQSVTIIGAKFGAFGAADALLVRSMPGVRPSVRLIGTTFANPASNPDRTRVTPAPA